MKKLLLPLTDKVIKILVSNNIVFSLLSNSHYVVHVHTESEEKRILEKVGLSGIIIEPVNYDGKHEFFHSRQTANNLDFVFNVYGTKDFDLIKELIAEFIYSHFPNIDKLDFPSFLVNDKEKEFIVYAVRIGIWDLDYKIIA